MNNFFNKYQFSFLILFILTILVACNKDYSYESSNDSFININTNASGSLQDSMGNCQNIKVSGYYTKDSLLTLDNNITVLVNFTSPGKFQLHTDTVNGVWFSIDSSKTYSTGLKAIKLVGHGKPLAAKTSYLNVHFLNSICTFSLTVSLLPPPKPHVSTETDYFPMLDSSYWTYDTITPAGLKDSLRYYITKLTKVVNGRPYKLFVTNHKDTNYYYKDGKGGYYNYNTTFASFNLLFEYKFLDDTLPVNSTWETPENSVVYQNAPYVVKYRCTIVGKNFTLALPTQSVDSVIQVKEEALLRNGTGPNDFLLLYSVTASYAKKIGLVLYDAPAIPVYRGARNWYIQ